MKKTLITAILSAALLTGCADTTSSEVSLSDQSSESILQTTEQHYESVPHNESTDTIQTNDIKDDNTIEESAEAFSNGVFPPEGITAPITTTPSTAKEYEPGKVLYGKPADRFYLEDVEYIESVRGYFGFVIEDDGDIVVEGEPEFEDNETVQALRELYSLEYVGLSHLGEHLFRYGDDLLAIVNFPEAMKHSVYFMDLGYDESQYYCARIFEPR